ncbi:MAG: hypothetical protein SGILL_000343 [Bacillariaceae sp.]
MTPSPYNTQQAYFGGLYRAADVKGTGNIGGAEAVQFFARSKLPVEVLKNIWTVADQPSTSSLNPPKFAVALRLIQLTQNGQKGQGANLAVPPGVQLRPVFFEGVSGVSVPMPPPPQGQSVPPTPQQPQRGMNGGPPPPTPTPQQQPLSPQRQQQQQQQPPPTPNSRALVGQDPYVMTPQERARYEAIFPEYAKPDGYMYGQEAVALFSKSGVDSTNLRDIWNMVDRPVDNRLDKLEFAMAMHLIVCVSKKNLPLPQGGTLPNSLLALKAATTQPPTSPTPTSPMRSAMPAPGAPLSPMPPSQQMPPPQQQMQLQPQVETVEETPMVGAPPIVASGGLSISDAFEGLTLSSDQQPPAAGQQYGSMTPVPPAPIENKSLPAYVPEVASPAMAQAPAPLSPQPGSYSQPSIPEPVVDASVSPPAAVSLPPSSSYDLGDAHSELDKLKGVLQKLQAENISLKAQVGNMSEEEKDVQRELGIVVAEIGKLSSELSMQRHQVLEAKNRLLEASAELKAQQEHKSVLTDLISEAQQTKDAINGATASIENANQHHAAMDAQKQDAMNKSDVFESNLFGYEESGTAMGEAPSPAQTRSAPEGFNNEPSGGIPLPAENAPLPALGAPASEPATDMYAQYSAPAPAQLEAPPTPQRYEAPPTPQRQMVPAQPQQQSQPTPTNLSRPPAVAGHNRQSSGFDSGFVMGGSAPPLPDPSSAPDQASMSSAARAHSSSGDYGFEDEEAFRIVEDMKKKAEGAAAAARDAEAASSRVASVADELRSDADKADANARTLRAKADEKKDRRFGGGKKKNMMREADQAAQDAAELKKRFMSIQTQVQDAATLAAETRREADRLKNEAEKAEIEMASAASLRDHQKKAPEPAPASNGYGIPPQADYGTAPQGGAPYAGAPAAGYGQAAPPGQAYYGGGGYGQPYGGGYDGGFGGGVMGPGGGQTFDLPSPSGFQQAPPPTDGYANPF